MLPLLSRNARLAPTSGKCLQLILISWYSKAHITSRAQCGGFSWNGATCCQSGSYCSKINDYYSQCIPGEGPATSKTSTLPASTTTNQPTSTSTAGTSSTTKPPPAGSGTATYSGNPYSGVNLWANSYYRSEVTNLAIPKLSGAMATAAAKVADVPSYQWM